jgi:hypothetical protein
MVLLMAADSLKIWCTWYMVVDDERWAMFIGKDGLKKYGKSNKYINEHFQTYTTRHDEDNPFAQNLPFHKMYTHKNYICSLDCRIKLHQRSASRNTDMTCMKCTFFHYQPYFVPYHVFELDSNSMRRSILKVIRSYGPEGGIIYFNMFKLLPLKRAVSMYSTTQGLLYPRFEKAHLSIIKTFLQIISIFVHIRD